ncbi:hypothetical protein SLEP1_g7980 [Rubroshorea leprosula]|uniref:Flavanone 4-reductase n=1 Tax=Rubroshorea leprosula TaxID=152421 RepID=A0AAV5I974_9ROSI|nr:hypothetical protein SLEP1_g7980 [Rubroshorea leprosula]
MTASLSQFSWEAKLEHVIMEGKAEIVCVTGASGLIGSWLVMKLLQKGYIVRATVRDPGRAQGSRQLRRGHPRLFWCLPCRYSHGLCISGSLVIKPTVDGAVDIVRSCSKAKTVRRLVFVSSAGAVVMQEHRRHEYYETCWSNVDFIRDKMTGWMYFQPKILPAWEAPKENGIDFIGVIPTLVVGPFIMPSMPPNLITALSLITGTIKKVKKLI